MAYEKKKHLQMGRDGKFSLRLIGSAMFGATFNLVTRAWRVGL